jgi:hypothetical protein
VLTEGRGVYDSPAINSAYVLAPRRSNYGNNLNNRAGINMQLQNSAQRYEKENPFEAFFSDPKKPSPAAINVLNNLHSGAPTNGEDRSGIERAWAQYLAS